MNAVDFITLPDGTRVAYEVRGQGEPILLFNGVTTSHFFWDEMTTRWRGRQLILWDYPGHGDSSPAVDPASVTIDSLSEIGLRVLDAVGVERAPCVGYSMGSQVALASGLRAPDRFPAVVSLLGPAGRMLDTALWGVGKIAEGLLRALPPPGLLGLRAAISGVMRMPSTYASGRLLRLYGAETRPEHVRALAEHVGRLHPETLRAMLLSANATDLHARLDELEPPLLIVSGERDAFAPTRTVGLRMHRAAPRSRFVVMNDGTHGSLFGHAGALVAMLERFFDECGVEQREITTAE